MSLRKVHFSQRPIRYDQRCVFFDVCLTFGNVSANIFRSGRNAWNNCIHMEPCRACSRHCGAGLSKGRVRHSLAKRGREIQNRGGGVMEQGKERLNIWPWSKSDSVGIHDMQGLPASVGVDGWEAP